jgi:hypothetical protein
MVMPVATSASGNVRPGDGSAMIENADTQTLPPPAPAATYTMPPWRHPEISGLAVASMIFGILWIFWLGSLVAVILGHVALRRIRQAQGRLTGKGHAIAGLLLGYLGLLALAIGLIASGVQTHRQAQAEARAWRDGVGLPLANDAESRLRDDIGMISADCNFEPFVADDKPIECTASDGQSTYEYRVHARHDPGNGTWLEATLRLEPLGDAPLAPVHEETEAAPSSDALPDKSLTTTAPSEDPAEDEMSSEPMDETPIIDTPIDDGPSGAPTETPAAAVPAPETADDRYTYGPEDECVTPAQLADVLYQSDLSYAQPGQEAHINRRNLSILRIDCDNGKALAQFDDPAYGVMFEMFYRQEDWYVPFAPATHVKGVCVNELYDFCSL